MNDAVCNWSNMFGGTTPNQNGMQIIKCYNIIITTMRQPTNSDMPTLKN